jgi:short-subunit dehydrogenase
MIMSVSKSFVDKYGPWALITGASSGIGEQFAHLIAQKGVNVLLVARRTRLLETLAVELRRIHGIKAHSHAVDLSLPDCLPPLIKCCEGKDIGLIVSNAGLGLKGAHQDSPPEKLSTMLNVNCRAPMLLTHAFIPALIERGRGGIILTASIEGFFGFPWSSAYSASKAFILSMGEGIEQELVGHNVDVLVLSPGATDTNMPISQGIRREELKGMLPPYEVARLGLAQLGRKPVFITGWINRMFIRSFSMMPRRLAVKLTGIMMHKAIERSKKAKKT